MYIKVSYLAFSDAINELWVNDSKARWL